MPAARANGITIEFETFGDRNAPPVLLIMGLGSQLTRWRLDFIQMLVDRGYFVVRFDNRDVGLSTWFDDVALESQVAPGTPLYSLSDMAKDAVGLLDFLEIPSAHLVGASLGGMIAQVFVLEHSERVRSLVSIMSSTGPSDVHLEVLAPFAVPATTREEAIENSVELRRVLAGSGSSFDEELTRQEAIRDYDRAYHPAGTTRQLFAGLAGADRAHVLHEVIVPTLVIHGEDDPLVDPAGGASTAAAIPGAKLKLLPGMGHDLPPELYEQVADDLAELFREGDKL